MILAGVRVGELTALRWRDVDLANARLNVAESKTDAGVRTVDVTPWLLDELKAHEAASRYSETDEIVFCTSKGTPFNRSNVRQRILGGAIERANEKLKKASKPPIAEGITNHTCRRTFASLLYEAGASPAYVMAQMGHTSSTLALEVYARKIERQRETAARMDALIRGVDWAQMGTSSEVTDAVLPSEETANVA
jgi:integrase